MLDEYFDLSSSGLTGRPSIPERQR